MEDHKGDVYDLGRKRERADVLAWLRSESVFSDAAEFLADRIVEGCHEGAAARFEKD